MKIYYVIFKSWWEVFSNKKIRIKSDMFMLNNEGKILHFRYKTYKDAHKAAIKIRKKDPYYRYDLGDRIYVRRNCYK